MKRTLLLGLFLALTCLLKAGLQTGDIVFVGFNTDGDDNFAIAAFDSIPANTTIYFCDSEWDGTGFGDDENDITWTSPITTIPAGTIISFDNIDGTITVSEGTVTGGTGLSKNGDALFAYLGTDIRQPTEFLAAITNVSTGFGDLDGTGLRSGFTAIMLTETADIAEYAGSRSGLDTNGYFALLNDMNNWNIQDTDGDDQNDGTTPDLPFNTTAFTFSATDISAPYVTGVKVISSTSVKVYFSEALADTSATNTSNYVFNPTILVSSVSYDAVSQSTTVSHAGLSAGVSTVLNVSGMTDVAGNTNAQSYQSESFYMNESQPELMISEIMYNAPVSFDDDVEFIEIINVGSETASLGGIVVKDESNFAYTFPEMSLDSGKMVLLATNKEVADTFYNVTFIDMVSGSGNMLGNGGELLQILNTNGDTIFSVEYDDASPWDETADGNGPSLELLNPAKDANEAGSWKASSTFLKNSEGIDIFASPGSFTVVETPSISFEEEYTFVYESAESVSVNIIISDSYPDLSSADIMLSDVGTAVNGTDFTFAGDSTVTFLSNSTDTITLAIPLIDNSIAGTDKFFVLSIDSLVTADEGSNTNMVVYILDDEDSDPDRSEELDMEFVTSYLVDENGSAEIVAFDSATQRLFVLNSTATKVEILDFSTPSSISSIKTVDMSQFGDGATSIAVKDGVVAATVDAGTETEGYVVFMDTAGNSLTSVTVGFLPDMVTFTPDGSAVLAANEGEPSSDYSTDPEGSISYIDISEGVANLTQSDVTNIGFTSFNSDSADLVKEGVRIFGLNATVAKDLEPEYITISEDSKTAWVSLQENNAIAVVDLSSKTVTDIIPLGTKDHSLEENAIDASDKNDSIFFSAYPVKGMYMPDAIASYTVNDTVYLVTANEGDQREYGVIDEDVSIGDDDYVLDATVFPDADILKKKILLGRLAVSPYSGDTDNDGDFDEIHVFGARSFSVWNSVTSKIVFDSKDDFERVTANDPVYGALFNASNSNNKFKNRSDNKGPEPEGVTVAEVDGKYYAFITLERTGGVIVYNITDPKDCKLVDYVNSRELGDDEGGDLGPEGIIYISAQSSPSDTAMVVVANEVSATISVWKISNIVAKQEKDVDAIANMAVPSIAVYPNPVSTGIIYFSKPASYKLYNMSGVVVNEGQEKAYANIAQLSAGVYTIVFENGSAQQLIVE